MMHNFGNRRSVQKCVQNAGSNILKLSSLHFWLETFKFPYTVYVYLTFMSLFWFTYIWLFWLKNFSVFCVYYVCHGLLAERPYEVMVMVLATAAVLIYIIVNYIVSPKNTVKLVSSYMKAALFLYCSFQE